MTKRPAELSESVRDENELVEITIVRAGWFRPALLPRWVATWAVETTTMLHAAKEEARREYASHARHWSAGFWAGLSVLMVADDKWGPAVSLVSVSIALTTAPTWWGWLQERWERWRGR